MHTMNSTKSQLTTGLKKATIEMMLLKLLSESDMYGYQMTQELKKRSTGIYTLLEGSMYPILYRLSDQEHVSFYEKKVTQRQSRVYYHLEEKGVQYLKQLLSDYEQFLDVISFLLYSETGDIYQERQ